MNKEKDFYYILIFLCCLWIIISLVLFSDSKLLYYINLTINPIGIILLSLILINNKLNNILKILVSIYFFIYGSFFLMYDIYNYIASEIGIDSFYFFSNLTMLITPVKVYLHEIKKRIKKYKEV